MNSLYFPVMSNGSGVGRISWAVAMMAACLTVLRGRNVIIQPSSYPYPDGNANIATHLFLESKQDEMVIIDTDVIPQPWHVQELLAHNVPLVSGIYPKKKLTLEYPIEALNESDTPAELFKPGGDPLVEVKRVPRGFLRIHRDVFTKLREHPEVIEYLIPDLGKKGHEYWKQMTGGHSDDFRFCDRYREVGGKVYVDKRLALEHDGNIKYPVKGYDSAS